jgi:hypothetical protein
MNGGVGVVRYERLRDKAGGGESLAHTKVERGNGMPKERQVDKRREVCEWEGRVCVCKP